MTDETCPCKLCGKPTRMLGTKLCDPCWELDRRIRADPAIAAKVLAGVSLRAALEELAKEYGSHRKAAMAHDLNAGQWNKLKNWGRVPTPSTLDKLGLVQVRTYTRSDHA